MSHMKEEIRRRIDSGESLGSVAKSLGVSKESIRYHRRMWGDPPLTHRFWAWRGNEKSRDRHLSRYANSVPEKFIDGDGYVVIRADRDGTRSLYHREHSVIVEGIIGRRIVQGREVVHHINCKKTDNSPGNLFLCSISKHRILHRSLQTIALDLVKNGVIVFEDGHYRWADGYTPQQS